jgi:hypothetical protein
MTHDVLRELATQRHNELVARTRRQPNVLDQMAAPDVVRRTHPVAQKRMAARLVALVTRG